jgi:hypothetical protein
VGLGFSKFTGGPSICFAGPSMTKKKGRGGGSGLVVVCVDLHIHVACGVVLFLFWCPSAAESRVGARQQLAASSYTRGAYIYRG